MKKSYNKPITECINSSMEGNLLVISPGGRYDDGTPTQGTNSIGTDVIDDSGFNNENGHGQGTEGGGEIYSGFGNRAKGNNVWNTWDE